MNVLIVVDPQNDFMREDAPLAVKGAIDIVPNINTLLGSRYFRHTIITQDWHPRNHISFASTHGIAPFSMKQTYQGNKFVSQMCWPDHCIEGTRGAEIFSGIINEYGQTNQTTEGVKHWLASAILRKGMNPLRENYSVFEYVNDGDETIYYTSHGLLFPKGVIDEITVVGIAFDYCVKQTAISAKRFCDNVVVLKDCTASVNPTHDSQVINDLIFSGIRVDNFENDEPKDVKDD